MTVHTVAISQSDLLRVPLFPLPDVVLFPGVQLPLHVFEGRYRQLVRDCMEGSRLLSVPCLRPPRPNDEGPPALHESAGLGRIAQCVRLPDGRFNIAVLGLCRARLRELPSDAPYRVAQVEIVPDAVPACPLALPAWHQRLRDTVKQWLPHCSRDTGRALESVLRAGVDSSTCADQVAALTLSEGVVRQRMLEELDPVARLERVVLALERQLRAIAPDGGSSSGAWN